MVRIFLHFVLLAVTPAAAESYNLLPVKLPAKVKAPAVVEAEEYDRDGDGVAYSDTTSINEGGELRTDGVDIYKFQEESGARFLYVGAIEKGDWMKYSLENPSEGTFDIEFRTASDSSEASLILVVGDQMRQVMIPYSGGWDSWRSTTVLSVKLPQGPLTMQLSTHTGKFNLDYVRFIRRSTPADEKN